MRPIKPALQYSEGRSKPWSGAKLINAFAEKADGDKATDFAVMAIPGLDLFVTVGDGPVRGLHVMDDVLYVVSGTSLYSVTQTGAVSKIGHINGTGPVPMQDNGKQLALCGGWAGYVYADGAIQRPFNLPDVASVAYIDSYFVWVIADSDQCIYSGINDGLSYDPLDVFTAEGSPDGLKAIINDHRELHLPGEKTWEIFYNAGGADNVFERQGNAFIERGCFDRDSIVKIDNSVHFLGDDRIAYRLDGYNPVRVSTHAIEFKLAKATWARAFTYTQEGHKFYVLNTDVGTFAYDMATGTWHERRSVSVPNYRVGCAVEAWGRTIMGDAYTGKLYTPNLDSNTENGEPIEVEIELPQIGDGVTRRTCYAFQVDMETGVGLNDGQGSDPQIMARYSKNGGRTWSAELWRSMGRIGEYLTRAVWRRWGQFYKLQVRLRITDPVRKVVLAYWADVR